MIQVEDLKAGTSFSRVVSGNKMSVVILLELHNSVQYKLNWFAPQTSDKEIVCLASGIYSLISISLIQTETHLHLCCC